MKLELCHFSQQKIYPSRGKKYIRIDGKVFNFANGKSEKSFFMKRNPREIRWTVLYRRKHKKGSIEEQSKRRNRKTHKFNNRAYAGVTIDQILQKRNQTSEVRKAQREQAIRAAKEKAAAKKKTKIQAASKLAQKSQQSKAKVAKVVSKGGGSRSGARR